MKNNFCETRYQRKGSSVFLFVILLYKNNRYIPYLTWIWLLLFRKRLKPPPVLDDERRTLLNIQKKSSRCVSNSFLIISHVIENKRFLTCVILALHSYTHKISWKKLIYMNFSMQLTTSMHHRFMRLVNNNFM